MMNGGGGGAEIDGVGVRLPPSHSHPNLPAIGAQVNINISGI